MWVYLNTGNQQPGETALEAPENTGERRPISPALASLPAFAAVPASNGAALYRHLRDARLFGLSYEVYPDADRDGWHRIAIESWTYGVQEDSLALPVMDFVFNPGGGSGPADIVVRDLKVMCRPMPADSHLGARAMSVALFFINQINAGQVPNCERILKLHGVYPGLHPPSREARA
jgi:hypothetical protein